MTILHPTDFSDVAEAAREVAVDLGRRVGATVHVLHVQRRFDADGAPSETVAATPLDARAIEHDREASERASRQLNERLRDWASDVPGSTWELRWGHPVREILDASSHDVDLIVMGAHGSNRLDAYFLGGIAGSVARRAHVPVVTVREEIPRRRLGHVLMATDFSDAARHAWHWLRGWARAGIRTSIVHVADDPRFAEDADYVARARDAIDAMIEATVEETAEAADGAKSAASLDGANLSPMIVDHRDVRTGDPIEVLPQVATEWGADAICVGTRRRTAAAGLLFGSRADALLRSCAVPIVSVPLEQ